MRSSGLIAIAASSESLAAALISSVVVALAAMILLMRFQVRAYRRSSMPFTAPSSRR